MKACRDKTACRPEVHVMGMQIIPVAQIA